MKRAIEAWKNELYVYDLFDHVDPNIVQIDKGNRGKEKYLATKINKKWLCTCPGFRYRQTCHHVDFINTAPFIQVDEPWAEIVKEAIELKY